MPQIRASVEQGAANHVRRLTHSGEYDGLVLAWRFVRVERVFTGRFRSGLRRGNEAIPPFWPRRFDYALHCATPGPGLAVP